MFSGAGVVAYGERASSMRCRKRETGLSADATHVQIFYNLGPGRVHFDTSKSLLYFVDCPEPDVRDLLISVFKGLNQLPRFEQMHLDGHKLLKGAVRVNLSSDHVAPTLTALKLRGIDLSISQR